MIDVIFILLLFFAISTTLIIKQKGINLQLPSATTVSETKKGIALVIDDQRSITLNKLRISEQQIKPMIQDLLQQNPSIQVILSAHRSTPYELIMTVLDQVRLGGCFDIVLEAKKKQN